MWWGGGDFHLKISNKVHRKNFNYFKTFIEKISSNFIEGLWSSNYINIINILNAMLMIFM